MIKRDGKSLANKIAFITGASRGIGKAIAISFYKEGAVVIVNYKTSKEMAEEIVKNSEGNIFCIYGDVSKKEDVINMANIVKEKFSKIDILVNNAGIISDNLILKMSDEQWEKVYNVCLKGVFLITREFIKIMNDNGSIINIGSISGLIGNVGQANYTASKSGLIGFSKSCAKEFFKRNIRVNVLIPGFTDTDMTSSFHEINENILFRRKASPEEISKVVCFLASEQAEYINGEVFFADCRISRY